MIHFKPKAIYRFLLVVNSVLIIFTTIFFFFLLQKQFINHWQRSVKVLVHEKNQNFNFLFFKNQTNLSNNSYINFDYFTNLLNIDNSLREHHFVDLFIINMNQDIIYRYNDNTPQFSKMYYTTDQILYLIKSEYNSIEIKSYNLEQDGNYYLIVVSPLINNQGYRINSIIYIFDYSFIMKKVFPFYMPVIMIIVLILFMLLSNYLSANYLILYLNQITNYISYHIFRDQGKPGNLRFSYPFNQLENKVTYLVAQRKELEDKFLDLNQKFNLLINQTNDGIMLEDTEGYIFYCNKKMEIILGLESDSEILGRRFKELLTDNDSLRKYELEHQFRHLKPTTSYRLSFTNKKEVKKQILISVSATHNNHQEIIGYYSAVTDLSDLETMSNEKQSLQKLRSTIMDLSAIPSILYDNDFKVVDLNQEMINFIQKPKKDLVSFNIKNTINDLDFYNVINQADLSSDFQIEVFEPKMNKWFYVMNTTYSIDEDIYHQLFFIDITLFRKEESFHQFILNDVKGFFFITNLQNKVIYVSPSFNAITHNPIDWFSNYYQSIYQVVEKKNQEFFDSFIISHGKNRYEFSVHRIATTSNTTNLYVCILK